MQNDILNRCLAVTLLSLAFSLQGCGGDSGRANVFGKVTVDGQPLEDGLIQFTPEVGTVGPPVQIQILNGEYRASSSSQPAVGKNSVQITAMKKSGQKVKNIMGEETDEILQFIPAKYNTSSELHADIKPKSNELNFELSLK